MSVNAQDMVLVHRVFRREFGELPGLVNGVAPGDSRRAKIIGDHLIFLTDALHHHHAAEDDLVWPILSARAPDRNGGIDRMRAQHAQIAAALDRAKADLAVWVGFVHQSTTEQLLESLANLSERMLTHLDDEERDALPLIVEQLTPAEWGAAIKRGASFLTKHPRLGIVLGGLVLDYASPDEGHVFLAGVPAPQRVLVKLLGARSLASYRRKLYGSRGGAQM